MAEKSGTIVAVPIVATQNCTHYTRSDSRKRKYLHNLICNLSSIAFFWRKLDVQLLFSNLVPKTFPKGSLLTIAHKRMKALKRAINQ